MKNIYLNEMKDWMTEEEHITRLKNEIEKIIILNKYSEYIMYKKNNIIFALLCNVELIVHIKKTTLDYYIQF